MRRPPTALFLVLLWSTVLAATVATAQWQWQRRRRPPPDRTEYPTWSLDREFPHDVFTFVRLRYRAPTSVIDGRWDNDYPDADWNFSYRLQQLTSLEVHPDGRVLDISDPALFDYPFVFMLGVRDLVFTEPEVRALRRYLHNGGFLMVDDFWAHQEWVHLRAQMQRVLPDRRPVELSLDHEIFHLVYDLDRIPQVPSIQAWRRGWTFEYWHGETFGDEDPHFYAYLDDRGRIMALLCHNNDICDGWEREGENSEYFAAYSERFSYPLGINIVMYALTH